MKKYIISFFMVILYIVLCENHVDATPANTNFKDDIFYKAIIDNLNNNNVNSISDRNIDYCVTDEELKTITSISCGSLNEEVKDMSGLEKLTELKKLVIKYPLIEKLDITKNTSLEYIEVLNANKLDNIDFSNNVNLSTIDLTYTHLKELNLNNCTKLISLEMGTGNTNDAKIEKIDLSNCKELTKLKIIGNQFTEINLENNINLTDVNLGNGKINKITLPVNSKIKSLILYNNEFVSLKNIENLNSCKSLNELLLSENHIMDISMLKNLKSLKHLDIRNNSFKSYLNER